MNNQIAPEPPRQHDPREEIRVPEEIRVYQEGKARFRRRAPLFFPLMMASGMAFFAGIIMNSWREALVVFLFAAPVFWLLGANQLRTTKVDKMRLGNVQRRR